MNTSSMRLLVACDVVDIDRMRRFLGASRRSSTEIFTEQEIAYARQFKDPVPRLAARFAAKEAVIKLLPGLCPFFLDWRTVEVVHESGGKPAVAVIDEAAAAAADAGIAKIELTISHSRTNAIALAAALVDQK